MKSRFLSAAEADFADATDYYQLEAGLGDRFIIAVSKTVTMIEKQPMIGHIIESSIRSFPVQTFPYSLIYEILPDEIIFIAVAHQSRKPRYWRARTIG